MYEDFNDSASKVIRFAKQEAQRFNHDYVGTEHLLAALAVEEAGIACHMLKGFGITKDRIRVEIEKIVGAGPDTFFLFRNPSMEPRAKNVIYHAAAEARQLQQCSIGTEHLLLGILCEPDCVAARILTNLGAKPEEVRQKIIDLVGTPK